MSIMDLFGPMRVLPKAEKPLFSLLSHMLVPKHNEGETAKGRKIMANINNKIDINKIIGNNIRAERKQRAITRDELAEVLGISSAHMALIERGERGVHALNFAKLSEFFDIPVSDFFTSKRKNGQTVFETRSPKLKANQDTIYTLAGSLDEQEMGYAAKMLRGLIAMRGDSD